MAVPWCLLYMKYVISGLHVRGNLLHYLYVLRLEGSKIEVFTQKTSARSTMPLEIVAAAVKVSINLDRA